MKTNPMLLNRVSEYTNISCMLLLIHQMVHERAIHTPNWLGVELGVNGGNSAVAITTALLGTTGRLKSFDIVDCAIANEYVIIAGARHLWDFAVEDSLTAANRFTDDSLDFIFLDTDHEYANTVKEIAAWTPKLKHGGRMLFHDTRSRPEGVAKPIAEFRAANPAWPYYDIDVDCGLGVLDKP